MRTISYGIMVCAVAAIGVNAYLVNHKARAADARIRALQTELSATELRIRKLQAEWAVLNRPDRLAGLLEKLDPPLDLIPATPAHMLDRLSDLTPPSIAKPDPKLVAVQP